MSSHRLESNLAWLYLTGLCLSVTTLSCSVVSWTHWREILDNCEESGTYCGCVLYGSETFNYFTGGSDRLCHFVVYASVPVVALAVVLAGYHGYRTFIVGQRDQGKSRAMGRGPARAGEVSGLTSRSRPAGHAWSGADPQCVCWGPLALLAALLAALLFAQAVVLSDGYQKTCNEYRKHLVKVVMATGQTATVIYDRMPCDAVIDFMDYLEPMSRPYRPFKDRDWKSPYAAERDRTRPGIMNTAAALRVAMATTWINCVVFVAIVVHNSILARSSQRFVKCCCC